MYVFSIYSFKKLYTIIQGTTMLLEGRGNPLQYSCLENPMDGGIW